MRATPLLSLAIAFCSAYVHAQERAGSAHVLAGLTFPYQPGPSGETEIQTYATAPGETTLGWTASAGLFIRSSLSVEGEAASTGVMRAREPSRYGQTFVEERRDRLARTPAAGFRDGRSVPQFWDELISERPLRGRLSFDDLFTRGDARAVIHLAEQ